MKTMFDRMTLSGLINDHHVQPFGHYDKLLRWFWDFRGSRLQYGVDLPLNTIVDNLEGTAPFTVFKSQDLKWSAVTIISIVKDPDVVAESHNHGLYMANNIEYICLTEDVIDNDYLASKDWKMRIKRAIYDTCQSRFNIIQHVPVHVPTRHPIPNTTRENFQNSDNLSHLYDGRAGEHLNIQMPNLPN